jgi:ATP-binding cassette subfamily F protein 3
MDQKGTQMSKSPILQAVGLTKSYGRVVALDGSDLELFPGEVLAVVGDNGAGKSTMIKAIMKQIDINSGNVEIGHNAQIGYFAQNQAALLDENATIFETIDNIAVGDVRTKIKDILGAFMFHGDDVTKKVKVLSGGEKTRLAMIKLLLEPVNLLILDEPSNHLDMKTKDIIKDALRDFDGTLILVSHDRDFLDGLATKVFEFGNKRVKEHFEDITGFLAHKKMESLREIEK